LLAVARAFLADSERSELEQLTGSIVASVPEPHFAVLLETTPAHSLSGNAEREATGWRGRLERELRRLAFEPGVGPALLTSVSGDLSPALTELTAGIDAMR
jgi:hypothetical protein